jgi:hypothetical protein
LAVDRETFEAAEDHVDFMKELAGHLELEDRAEANLSDEAAEYVRGADRGVRVGDLRQLKG